MESLVRKQLPRKRAYLLSDGTRIEEALVVLIDDRQIQLLDGSALSKMCKVQT